MDAALIDSALRNAGLPIVGVSVSVFADRATWSVVWEAIPTEAERVEAQRIIGAVDVMTADEKERDFVERMDNDRLLRLLFEMNFDQENRLRAAAGQQVVTRGQYLDAIKAIYRGL